MNKEWVFIDTHTPGRGRLGWFAQGQSPRVYSYRGGPATLLRRLFTHERARLMSSAGICVIAGPGSFSSIRIGVLYANLLARLLQKPLVGLRVEEAQDLKAIWQICTDCASQVSAYVAPVYDAEPNITLPRTIV